MSFTSVLIGSAEKPKRSFRWSLVSVRQQLATYVTLPTTYLAKKKTLLNLAAETREKGVYWFQK